MSPSRGVRDLKVGEEVMTTQKAPSDYRGRRGVITEIASRTGTSTAEYRIEFEDGRQPTTGYLPAKWLDR